MTHYEILGVGRNATQDQIKQAYRREALRWHPDTSPDDPNAEERFKRVAQAYQVLSTPQQRQDYDRRIDTGLDEESPETLSYKQAFYLFMQQMMQLAFELTLQNVPHSRIAQELVERGCPKSVADQIAARVERERKTRMRSSGGKLLVRSVLMVAGGVLVTAVLYELGWIVGFGIVLVFSGIVNSFRALYFMSTGRAPRQGVHPPLDN